MSETEKAEIEKRSDYLEKLNEYQRKAVLDESDACVVNANVGSGKTTVLISKIQYLHEVKQIPYEKMVVLTFTNKAAYEIQERLEGKRAIQKHPELNIRADGNGDINTDRDTDRDTQTDRNTVTQRYFGTFHGVALQLLREVLPIDTLGYGTDFMVIEPEEELELALKIIQREKLHIKYRNRLKKRLEQEKINRYGDDLETLRGYLQTEKRMQNKMSFTDLIVNAAALLKDHPVFFSWIIIDEVQDSDGQQLAFIDALKGQDTHLFAVGDPNQVIYSWRGSACNVFYTLREKYQATELSLPVNYRSSGAILEAAKLFLQNGSPLTGVRDVGNQIIVKKQYDSFQEACYLADKIKCLHEKGLLYKEIAVFYRLQNQSEVLESVFQKENIPYEVSVKKTIHDIPVLDWFMKVLRFSICGQDSTAGMQALSNRTYGVGLTEKAAEKKIRECLLQENQQHKEKDKSRDKEKAELHGREKIELRDPEKAESWDKEKAESQGKEKAESWDEEKAESQGKEKVESWDEEKADFPDKEKSPGRKKDELLLERMCQFQQRFSTEDADQETSMPIRKDSMSVFVCKDSIPTPGEIYDYYGLDFCLHPTSASYGEDKELILELLQNILDYSTEQRLSFVQGLADFISSSALYGVNILHKDIHTAEDSVKLMTLHASKGLEFSYVFIIGVNYGLIPLQGKSFDEEDEERRLFFVGMTRAKDRLELSYYTNPDTYRTMPGESRFIRMIPPRLIQADGEEAAKVDLHDLKRQIQEERKCKRIAFGQEEKSRKNIDQTEKDKEENKAEKQEEQKNMTEMSETTSDRQVTHPKYGTGTVVREDDVMITVNFEGYGEKEFVKAFTEFL